MASLPALPEGWIQQYDSQSNHPYWVDTRANPPRSSWIHPYHNEQFLSEHPGIREQIAAARASRPPNDAPPPYAPRRNSFSGPSNNLNAPMQNRNALSQPGVPPSAPANQHRGLMAKLQDKMSGMTNNPQAGNSRGLFGQQPYGYGGPGYGQPQYAQPMYGPPPGDAYAVSRGRYGRFGGFGGNGGGAGRLALPLVGGMAGGLILGDLLDDHRGGFFGGPGYGPGFGDPFGGPFGGGFGDPFFGDPFGGPFDNGFGGGFGGFDGGFDGGFGGGW